MPKIPVYQMKKDIIYGRVPKKKQPYKFDFESAERAPYVDDGLDHYDEEAQMSTIAGKRDPFLDYMAMKRSQPTERVQEEDPYAGIDPDAEALPALPEMEFNKPEDYYDEERQQSMMTPRKMSKERPSKDDLMSYLQGKMGKKSLQEEAEEPVDMAKTVRPTRFTPERLAGYRNQRFMNDIIPAVAKAGAMIGTVGGRSPKSVIERDDTDYRAQDEAREDKENARSDRKEALYEALREKMSDNALNRQRMDQEAQRFGLTHDLAKKGLELKEQEHADSKINEGIKLDILKGQVENKDPGKIEAAKIKAEADVKRAEIAAAAALEKAKIEQTTQSQKDANQAARDLEEAKNKLRIANAQAKPASTRTFKPTEAETNSALHSNQMAIAEKGIEDLAKKGYTGAKVMDVLRGNEYTQSITANEDDRLYNTYRDAWVEAYLRKTSGAAVPEPERRARALNAFPRMNDSPQVIAEKKKLRMNMAENMATMSGEAGKRIQDSKAQKTSNPPPPKSKAEAAFEELKTKPNWRTDPKYQKVRDKLQAAGIDLGGK